jgi:hypothetical protein
MDAPIGPDGFPAVFEGGGWHSHDHSFWWNGADWVPANKSAYSPWLIRIGTSFVLLALLGYAVYTMIATSSEFAVGYYAGVGVFFTLLFVIFRFAGRWGGFGTLVRAGSILLAVLKVLTLLTHRPPF